MDSSSSLSFDKASRRPAWNDRFYVKDADTPITNELQRLELLCREEPACLEIPEKRRRYEKPWMDHIKECRKKRRSIEHRKYRNTRAVHRDGYHFGVPPVDPISGRRLWGHKVRHNSTIVYRSEEMMQRTRLAPKKLRRRPAVSENTPQSRIPALPPSSDTIYSSSTMHPSQRSTTLSEATSSSTLRRRVVKIEKRSLSTADQSGSVSAKRTILEHKKRESIGSKDSLTAYSVTPSPRLLSNTVSSAQKQKSNNSETTSSKRKQSILKPVLRPLSIQNGTTLVECEGIGTTVDRSKLGLLKKQKKQLGNSQKENEHSSVSENELDLMDETAIKKFVNDLTIHLIRSEMAVDLSKEMS